MRVDAEELGVVALGDGAEHLARALRGGELIHEAGVVRLAVADPARAARGEHRELLALGVLEARQKLAALLHDGEVSGEVRVEDVVEAEHAQSSDETVDRRLFAREAEGLAPSSTHGGSNLHDDDLVRVGESVEDALGVITLAKGARRAVSDALAAEGTAGLIDGNAALHAHARVARAVGEVPHARGLDLLAHLDAAQTVDALVVVADERIVLVPGLMGQVLLVGQGRYAEVVGNGLQRAVARTDAARALRVVTREQELHVDLPRETDLGAVCADDHAVEHRVVAGGDELVDALDLNDAGTAGADFVEVLEIAERRNLDVGPGGRIENRGVLGNADGTTVDSDVYHCSILPPRKAPKPK